MATEKIPRVIHTNIATCAFCNCHIAHRLASSVANDINIGRPIAGAQWPTRDVKVPDQNDGPLFVSNERSMRASSGVAKQVMVSAVGDGDAETETAV